MKLFLLNALINPYQGDPDETAVFITRRIDLPLYEQILKIAVEDGRDVVSALGHESTVDFLKGILAPDAAKHLVFNRESIFFEPGDLGLVCRVAERGDFMKEWSLAELMDLHKNGRIEFFLVTRVFAPELILDPKNFFASMEASDEH
ncbi:STIV orfB116 family protein [Desulfococcus multivorans]|uniref:Uncharacterized protein n=1 Tax=Desulfococcus multivorans DSM 2059 TaxID=1121405 RepID=S7ULU1_DESML|nr:DUF1874 domain-containing protein [Desulfococcus multivorans]AOY59360.1 uncharacterized protein, DUF1874 [Desulfococcus multivorans]AQV01575.1 hypothetical protein B2D07_12955 [Desulfococcus multivorans]EPR33313.1 protein of unknown function DUF1874 [Desulfococcus multivorans DSM 2059]SKA13855.1 protein of unknown function [Desulfococcus multivorans DSM 2059]